MRPDVVQFLSFGILWGHQVNNAYWDDPGMSLLFGTSKTSSLLADMDTPVLYPDCPGTNFESVKKSLCSVV